MWFKKHVVTAIAASMLGLPLLTGCSFDADTGHHDRDWGRPAGYRYRDRDRDYERERYHEWHDHDRDWHDHY